MVYVTLDFAARMQCIRAAIAMATWLFVHLCGCLCVRYGVPK